MRKRWGRGNVNREREEGMERERERDGGRMKKMYTNQRGEVSYIGDTN